MAVINRVVKPTTRKGKKVLLSREPQIIEPAKQTILFQGRKASETVRNVLKDIYSLKKPEAKMLTKKNDITVFEDATPVEAFCRKHESPLFIMGSHSKKRPDNLILGRMFDYHLLDMVELKIDSYKGINEFSADKIMMGIKPCLVFAGTLWEQNEDLKSLQNILVDMFHREKADAVRLQGLEHVISFTVTPEAKILFRSYRVLLKKSGSRTPRIELEEFGPRINLSLRRTKLASEDLMKKACQKPKETKVVKVKNIHRDNLGNTHGRIHLGKQKIDKIQTRKMKGLRKSMAERKAEKRASSGAADSNGEANENSQNESPNKRVKIDAGIAANS